VWAGDQRGGAPRGACGRELIVADAVRQRLLVQRERELADLEVSVASDGTVRLSGRTYTLAMADRAVQIARRTPGVTRVRRDILALPKMQR
jgi:osmotically-inducible protein OsmY